MKLCKHQPHKVIDDIWEPKWSTNEILIHVDKVPKEVEHYIIRFKNKSPRDKYGWFYLSGKVIRRYKKQPNGKGFVYCVPMSKRESFIPIKNCNCMNVEMFE